MRFRSSLPELLQELQPHASYRACDELLEPMKAAKTARELHLLDKAAELAGVGFSAADAAIRPGLRESEIAAALQARFETAPGAKAFQPQL